MEKKTLFAAFALATSAIVTLPAYATDGVINFTGLVTDVTCTIEGTVPGTGGATKDVPMNGISAANLDAAGKFGPLTRFEILVGGPGQNGCTDGRSALIAFDTASPMIDVATGRLNIDGWNVPTDLINAKNVQIQVTKQDGTPLNLYTEKSDAVVIASNQAIIPLAARYYATGAATAGLVASRVGFTIEYTN
ncbi:fimbrial protein [Pseudomonas sp. McL0111]|uniref:fimbrial protein n=1 Tax=Pseudomonas sp. McL0111 TaxID=3457357 RepID=UPI00403EC002